MQVEDDLNYVFVAKWLSVFGLKSPTSLETSMALQSIGHDYQLLGKRASEDKLEAS